MSRAVDAHCDNLSRIKCGAASSTEPKFIWIKMINRIGCHDHALAIRHKFNTVLENVLTEFQNHYIIDINRDMADSAFYINEIVTKPGATQYWIEIDNLIKQYDAHNVSLKPIK